MDNTYVIHDYKVMLNNRLPVLKEVSSYMVEDASAIADTPKKIVSLANQLFSLNELAEEFIYMFAFDSKFHPLGVFEISHGCANISVIQGREVFIRLCLVAAVQFILVHNHPSGISSPSGDDKIIANKMKELGNLTGITLRDFIIVGDNNYYSFKEEGLV